VGDEDVEWSLARVSAAATITQIRRNSTDSAWELDFRTAEPYSQDGFLGQIKSLGVYKNKHIPEVYLSASLEQRRALFAGLMDTDGSVTDNNKTPQCEYSSSDPALAESFHQLARSLGIKTTMKVRATKRKDNYRFLFTCPFNPFQMPRKAEAWRPPSSKRHELMSITSIKRVPSVPTRCINIESEDGVYLVGKLFTPTHNTVLEVRELAGLFMLHEGLIVHTAQQFSTSEEHMQRLVSTIENTPALDKHVLSLKSSNGKESITLKPTKTIIFGSEGRKVRPSVKPRLKFMARSKAAARGFAGVTTLVWDESMILDGEAVAAQFPIITAAPNNNPQLWLTGSSGLPDSFELAARRRHIHRDDKTIFGAEWAITPHDETCPRDRTRGRRLNDYIVCDNPLHDDRDDPRSTAKANPAYNIRLSPKTLTAELNGMDANLVKYDRERLGVGEWPAEEEAWSVISEDMWKSLTFKGSWEDLGEMTKPVALAVDVAENGSAASIAACWVRRNPLYKPLEHAAEISTKEEREAAAQPREHFILEIPKGCAREGTDWVLPELDRLRKKYKAAAVVVPRSGPAAALIDATEKLGMHEKVFIKATAGEEAAAYAFMMQGCREKTFMHMGRDKNSKLWYAVGRGEKRISGDGGFSWSRRDSDSDITPITAACLALWACNKKRRSYDLAKSYA
jgi:hypothetical protein